MKVFIDIETRSRADLPEVGAYRYGCDPSTDIMMMAVTDGTGVFMWINPKFEDAGIKSDPRALELLREASLVYAHNAPFELAVMHSTNFDPFISLDKWRCTMAMARMAGGPESLQSCAEWLRLPIEKDTRGKALIRRFSLPAEDGTFSQPVDHKEEWREFVEYCRQDVKVEREIYLALKDRFELTEVDLQTWQLTLRMNDAGIPVNRKALENAQRIIDEVTVEAAKEFRALTGLNITQREAVRKWLEYTHGRAVGNMQANTLEQLVPLMEGECRRAVQLYLQLSFAATKKVRSMLDWICPDDRMHGVLKFYGAGTGRWSAGGPQIQNAKKATPAMRPITKEAYAAIERGATAAEISAVYGEPLEVIASSIRHFVQLPGSRMLDADYAAIEARIACWLSDDEEALTEYKTGMDRYRLMAAQIFNVAPVNVTSDQRDLGKSAILGLGYGMGAGKFKSSLALRGITIPDELAERAKNAFRRRHAKMVRLWGHIDQAAKETSVTGLRSSTVADGKLAMQKLPMGSNLGRTCMFIRLPSGRRLAYPDFDIINGEMCYFGQTPGTSGFAGWGRIKLYGAKLFENICQAVAADLMSYGAQRAEDRFMAPFALIHDQALAIQQEGQTPDQFASALQELPPWARGLPLKAEAKSVPYYSK